MEHAKSYIKLQDPDRRAGYFATARVKPSLLLKGETPRLIDEWQDIPVIWDAVRMAVDERRKKGQFILTGSTVMDEKRNEWEEFRRLHSGTGRISTITMYPMSCSSLESRVEKYRLRNFLTILILTLMGLCRL